MPGVQSAARFRAHFVVLAMLVAACCCIAGAQAQSAHAYGSTLGSFEIDGNLIDNSGGGEPIDWATPPPNLNNFTDGSGKGDDGFAMGSKETVPSGWTCINQSAPGKDDILSGQVAFRTINGKQFAYVNFFRKAVTGDAHIDYEFNKSTMANPACPSTPARSDGDVVITFDTENGGKFIFVKLQRWNAATSSFTEIDTAGKADGAVNIPANGGLSIPGHKDGDFGEAVINLTDTIGEVTCGQFSTAYMKSRSSTSIDSALQDRTKSQPLNVGACPQSTLSKGVRNQTTNAAGQFATTATAKPGDTLRYQLTYKNTGSATATDVVITDKLEPRQTLVASTCVAPGCTYDAATRTLTWKIASVAPGATQIVTFDVVLDATFPQGDTVVKNASLVTSKEEQNLPPKTSNETTTTVKSSAVSEPGKGVRNVTAGATTFTSSTTAAPGDIVEYQLTYKNAGTSPATDVKLSDPIPSRTSFVSCSDSCTQTGSPVSSVSWTIATVAPGETVIRTFRVKIDPNLTDYSPIGNVATACATSVPCKDSPPVTVQPQAPKSSLAKAVRNATTGGTFATTANAVPGDNIEYRITYSNSGNAPATNVKITDTLAAGQTLVASTCVAPACTYDAATRTLTWTFASVPGPGSQTVTFTVKLDATFPGSTTIKNVANVTTTQEGTKPPPSNETTVNVTSLPKSEPGKTAQNITTGGAPGTTITASPGDTIQYNLTYKNAGTSPATNVVLSDPIPARTTFVSCSDSCTQTKDAGGVVTEVSWTLASVAPGETVTRTFRVKLDDTFPAGATTPVTNVAKACIGTSCVSTPPVTVNVKTPSSSTNKDVRVLPDGTFANTASATPGDSLEYRLIYTNSGPGDAHDVTLSDVIADGQTFVSCTGSCDSTTTPGTVTWSLGTVAAGASRTVTFIVKLDDTFPAGTTTIDNVAVSKTREEGQKPSDKTTVTVTAKPDLKLEKSASSPTTGKAVAGEEITYTLAYRNDGDATAAGTTIEETVPAGTEYVSCSPSCTTTGTPVSSVTFTIGSVPAGGNGTVTLTVRVKDDVGCQVCNTAQIKSPSQNNGTAVNSNQVCLTGVPGPNPAGANASGNAAGLVVKSAGISLLGVGLVPAIDERLSDVSSAQHGVGTDGRSESLLSIPAPVSSLVAADVIRGTTSSSVTESPARARNTSTATTADVNVLSGVVTAQVVNASAQATATGDASSVSAAGTRTAGLIVAGINRDNVPPNTTVNVDVVGMTGVTVTINEQIVTTSGPAPGQTSGGTYRGHIEVNGVHVRVVDADLLKGGKQPIDIIVSHAVADADFPQTRLCETAPLRSVSGHAFIASVKTAPNLVDIVHGFAGIPTSGGSDYQSVANVDVNETGGLVDADAADSSSTGTVTTLGASATSYAQAANVCVIAPMVPDCVVRATLVRSQSNSSATGIGRSSDDTGTTLQNISVAGTTIPIPLDPAPNTVIPLLGIGTLVLNEQIPDAPETGHTGLTVRALRLTLLDPAAGPLGAEVIVAEAHSDARFIP